jgi:hypothetical protein
VNKSITLKEGTTMTFLRTSQKPFSRQTRATRNIHPALEACESRQLMSGVTAAADLPSLKKGAAPAIVEQVGIASPTTLADFASPMRKHDAS